jgi:ribosomal protein L11 methyltransferase
MDYIQITFQNLQPEQIEMLVAQLSDAGYEGFEEHEKSLDAYISQKNFDALVLNEVAYKYQLGYTTLRLAETNWNKLWESNFQPVVVNDFVSVRADFHPPLPGTEFEIIITPKMSFGTGHHATTYMMIEQMRKIDFKEKKVLDFGTGTGILAILAEKLGAASVIAIDDDDWSIENAAENFARNKCSKICLKKKSEPAGENTSDITLANINKNIILANWKSLCSGLPAGGVLLVSGLLTADKPEINDLAKQAGLQLTQELTREGWICIQYTK